MKILKIILMNFICLLLTNCTDERPIDYNPVPWDTDLDGISNCVENNNANSHHNFNPNQQDNNPSIAHGLPYNGTLGGGINICDNNTGYYHFLGTDPVDTDDWSTLKLVQVIEAGGRRWQQNYNFNFGFGDMSLQNGGAFPDHVSHQNGLDVDMRYIRTDGQQLALDIAENPQLYDAQATVDLMNFLIQEGDYIVTHIFVDTNYARIGNKSGNVLHHLTGHTNHFHVRIQDPDGTNN